jgi:hypothetical protein
MVRECIDSCNNVTLDCFQSKRYNCVVLICTLIYRRFLTCQLKIYACVGNCEQPFL